MTAKTEKIEAELNKYIAFMQQQGKPITALYLQREQIKAMTEAMRKELGPVFREAVFDNYQGFPVKAV